MIEFCVAETFLRIRGSEGTFAAIMLADGVDIYDSPIALTAATLNL